MNQRIAGIDGCPEILTNYRLNLLKGAIDEAEAWRSEIPAEGNGRALSAFDDRISEMRKVLSTVRKQQVYLRALIAKEPKA